EISTKWNEKQSEKIFNALMFVSKHSISTNNDEYKDESSVRLLQLISTKLNDKQLYLLMIHLLERAKKKCEWYVKNALLEISEDMWKRATIYGLKEKIQMKNENILRDKENSNNCIWEAANDTNIQLLAFGLMIFNPCIQLSCDDNNINFDALNDNIDRGIEYPCLNNEIEEASNDENAFKGCHTV
ncbi:hypothetical protein RFI_37309, partial [Reticulomyxa filosa]